MDTVPHQLSEFRNGLIIEITNADELLDLRIIQLCFQNKGLFI